MTAPRLGYVIRYVRDVEATVAFYEAAFGLTRRFVHPSGYAEMETGATALAFAAEELAAGSVAFLPTRPDAPAPAQEIGLVTDDVPALHGRALAAGATEAAAPRKKPWGQTVSYVRDPDGALVELCTPVPP